MKEKYGVSEFELFGLALDTAIGVGGRMVAAEETADRRRQRAAREEAAGAGPVSAPVDAFRAQSVPGDIVEASRGLGDLVQARGNNSIIAAGPIAPEDLVRLEGARQPTAAPATAPTATGESASNIAGRAMGLLRLAEERRVGPWRGPEMDEALAGDWARIESEFKRANDLAWRTNDEQAKADSLRGLSLLHSNLGRSEEARRQMDAAVATERQMMAASAGTAQPYQWPSTPSQRIAAAPGPAAAAPPPRLSAVAPQMQQPMQQAPIAQPAPQQQRAAYIPTTLGEAQVMARTATTQEELAAAMEQIDQLARATNLQDLVTGGHIRRAQEAALKGWKPPRGETALDRVNIDYRRQQTATSRALELERIARTKAGLKKSEAKLLRGLRRVPRGDAEAERIVNAVKNHRRHYDDYAAGAGDFSNEAIASQMAATTSPPPGGFTQSDIDAERDARWSALAGSLAGEDEKSREIAAQNALGPSKRRKAYRKIVSETGDDLAKARRETRLREHGAERIGLSKSRAAGIEAEKASKYNIRVADLRARADTKAAHAAYLNEVADLGEADATLAYRDRMEGIASALASALQRPQPAASPAPTPGIPTYIPGTVSKPTQLESSGR